MSSKRNIKAAVFVLTAFMGISAVVFAQQDGLMPPPGPVTDTQPSLFSLGESIATIQATLADPPSNQVFYVSTISNGSTATLNVGRVRIERIIVNRGAVDVKPQGAFLFTAVAAAEILSNGAASRLEPFVTELGIEVDGPVEFTGADSSLAANITVLYRELP